MNRFTIFFLAAVIFGLVPAAALADEPVTTIQAGARIEYRFDYVGDGSAIKVEATETDPNSLVVSIYTSDKIDAVRRNEPTPPTGRGTQVRGDTLQWSGGFPGKSTYYVVVENRASFAITYRISITGSGVTGVARAMASWLGTTSTITDQKGQRILSVSLPPTAVTTTLRLVMPPQPSTCTSAKQISGAIDHSIKLCPGEVYPPLNIAGDNIALYADDARSALVTSSGRQFAITVQGSNNWIEGVTIQASADPKDAGAWLCLYDQCDFPTRTVTATLHGGLLYGGGILLQGSNSTIHGVTVRGGTIGIATVNGNANKIIENQLSDLNGWGSFNLGATETYFVGNTWSRDNHGCTAPDGRKFLHGCETSGWVCLGCVANLISYNQCQSSSNCFYMTGERNPSNDNNFLTNYCAGATENCFEVTFSFGNIFRDNIATVEPKTDTVCNYPFWIGGSIAYFANNVWECRVSEDDAFNQSRDSTTVATNIIRLDNVLGALNAPAIVLPTITPVATNNDSSQLATAVPTSVPTAVPTRTPVRTATPTPSPGKILRLDQILRLVK
jgi:hypothetical protein